nr:TPM domain-containing protein [uncultured Clostridium sp.]
MTVAYAAQNQETSGNETRVFDDAGLFKADQKKEFEATIQSMKKEMNMDVVIATADDAGGRTAKEYAENFYIERKFGVGSDYRGVLFLIDMDNREMYILPVGKMNRFLTDKRWNAILDDAYKQISQGDYAACARTYLDGVMKYYREGIPGGQYNYDADTGKISVYRSIQWYEAALAVLMAAAAGAAVCGGVMSRYSMGKERGRAHNSLMSYRADCEFHYSQRNDNLVNTSVTHVIIPRDTGGSNRPTGGMSSAGRSTTHSNSGRTMGGGGRKF